MVTITLREFVENCIQEGKSQKEIYNSYDVYKRESLNNPSYKTYRDNVKRILKNSKRKDFLSKNKKGDSLEKEINGDKMNLVSVSSDIKTLEDLISFAEVDMTKYTVKRYKVNQWTTHAKNEKGNLEPIPNYQVTAQFEEINSDESDKISEFRTILEQIKNHSPKVNTRKYPKHNKNLMAEFALMDHHLGQLSWGEETGSGNYNSEIARDLALQSATYFYDQMKHYKPSEIWVPIGNDFFNVNSSMNTTFSGTLQDEDSRMKKTYVTGKLIWVEILDMLSAIAPVRVKGVPGNHDEERSFYMVDTLASWYHNDKNVEIDNRPLVRKAYQWGNTGLMYVHGHEVKGKGKLPLIFAEEYPEIWVNTKYREVKKGHYHAASIGTHQILDEHRGVREYVLPSLVDLDYWHTKSGYKALRESISTLYDIDRGRVAELNFRPV